MLFLVQVASMWLLTTYPVFATDYVFGTGDHVCATSSQCADSHIDIESGSNFSLHCKDPNSCDSSTIVVHSGCTLRDPGIDCNTKNEACINAKISVNSSDLTTNEGVYLNCISGAYARLCKYMQLTLTDSRMKLRCGSNDCRYLEARLFGSSTLELVVGSLFSVGVIYLFDETVLIDNGITDGYELFDERRTSTTIRPITTTTLIPSPTTTASPITSTTTIPTMTTMPTRTNVPITTTTVAPITTTTTIPTTTVMPSTTAIPSMTTSETTLTSSSIAKPTYFPSLTPTLPTTTPPPNATTDFPTPTPEDDSGDGSNGGISATVVYGCIGGSGVLLLLLVAGCSFYLGKHSGNGKQKEGEEENTDKVEIALVPKAPLAGSGPVDDSEERETEGRICEADADALTSDELDQEMIYFDMPKNYTPGGYLPHSPEGCQRQVEGGDYGTQ